TSNILLDKKQNYINDNPYKIYKKTLTILDDNINFCKKIELFNDDIINNHKLLIHNITFKDNKKYILVYSADITPFLNKITKMKKNFFHTAFDVYNYFHINMNITDTINILKKSLISDKINMNNTLLLQINILKSNNVFQETINKKLLTIIMNACFLINFQEHKGCIDCIFLKLKINYKEKTAKISIFSKNYALCIALKESLISLKNTFNKYNFQLKNIIIKNNDCFKNKNYDDNNNFINQRSFFSIIINNNKNIQDSVIRNKIYFQNKYFTSNVIDIYA
ncbi:MAG TPA: hypothetical protein VK482_01110, partial [Buchnera sp. (in: enterobacteria)]|nr:hypothetical protein [Buchnera sp. (in: enterobacteria)]